MKRIKAQDVLSPIVGPVAPLEEPPATNPGQLSMSIDEALSQALLRANPDGSLSPEVYEEIRSKLGETEQAAFDAGLVNEEILVQPALTLTPNTPLPLASKKAQEEESGLAYFAGEVLAAKEFLDFALERLRQAGYAVNDAMDPVSQDMFGGAIQKSRDAILAARAAVEYALDLIPGEFTGRL